MDQQDQETDALMNSIIQLECRIEALMKILQEAGVPISAEQLESETHRIHATQSEVKKHVLQCRMKDSRFDLR